LLLPFNEHVDYNHVIGWEFDDEHLMIGCLVDFWLKQTSTEGRNPFLRMVNHTSFLPLFQQHTHHPHTR
jgi:hypothetical protein